jgi:hypothetical protein
MVILLLMKIPRKNAKPVPRFARGTGLAWKKRGTVWAGGECARKPG